MRSEWASLAVSMMMGNVRLPAQDPAQLHPVETGKHQVQDDQLGFQFAGQVETGRAIMSDFGGKSDALKVHLDPVGDPGVVSTINTVPLMIRPSNEVLPDAASLERRRAQSTDSVRDGSCYREASDEITPGELRRFYPPPRRSPPEPCSPLEPCSPPDWLLPPCSRRLHRHPPRRAPPIR